MMSQNDLVLSHSAIHQVPPYLIPLQCEIIHPLSATTTPTTLAGEDVYGRDSIYGAKDDVGGSTSRSVSLERRTSLTHEKGGDDHGEEDDQEGARG